MRIPLILLLSIVCLVLAFQGRQEIAAAPAHQNVATQGAIAHSPGAFVTVNGVRLWYESEGSGEPLVLIAGGPGFSHSYFHLGFSELSKSNRVIYFDAYGRGKSDRAKNPQEYTFSRDVEDVEGLRKALGLKQITVLGHSYGGMVAQAYALRYPDAVRKLILSDTLFSAEMWQANNDTTNFEIRNQAPEVWEKLQSLRANGLHSCTKEYQDALGEVPLGLFYFYNAAAADSLSNVEPPNSNVYCSIVGDDADFLVGGDISKLDFRSQLRNLKVPVLILTGRFDRVALPRFAVQFKVYAPQAQFIVFEKSGHFPFIEESQRTFQVLREFLQK